MIDAVLTLVLLIAILGLLVFVHEFGHFMAAKIIGVEVEEFAFGFGPSIIARKYKDTVYKINCLPLGGYVKILGDQDASSFQKIEKQKYSETSVQEYNKLLKSIGAQEGTIISRIDKINESKLTKEEKQLLLNYVYKFILVNDSSFFDNKPAYKQIFVFVAGVLMNFFIAIIFFNIFLFLSNQKTEIAYIAEYNFIGTNEEIHYKPVIEHFYNEELKKQIFDGENISSPIQLISVDDVVIKNKDQFESIWSLIENKEIKIEYFVFGEGKKIEKNLILNSDQIDTNLDPEIQGRVIIVEITQDSPAEKGGLKRNDILLKINGQEITNKDNNETFITFLNEVAGEETQFEVLRDTGTLENLRIKLNEQNDTKPLLGAKYHTYEAFYPGYYYLDYSGKGILQGVYHSINITGYNPVALFKIIKVAIETKDAELASQTISSVWGVGEQYLSKMVISRDYLNIINTIGIISVALAFMNILPIPLLDGGQIMFLVIEKIKGSPISPSIKEKIALVSFYFLMGFSVLIILKDVWSGFIGKFIREVV